MLVVGRDIEEERGKRGTSYILNQLRLKHVILISDSQQATVILNSEDCRQYLETVLNIAILACIR